MKLNHLAIAALATAVAAIAIGAGVAVAQPTENETPITGDAFDKATAAALAFTGGGTITQTKVGDEDSYYQVEVALADGTSTDVQLDSNFRVVASKTESADTETPDAPGGGH
jgi:uncharacterized membrane protein YkoI